MSLTPYAGWSLDFKSVQRSNQFDQFSELGQHEYSCRGIWRGVLTCDRSLSEGRSPGNTQRKRELSLLPYARWK